MAVNSKRFERQPHAADNIGKTIKELRIERGYTRDQMAERSGMAPRYLSSIENEGQMPSVRKLYDIIQALGVSADHFFWPERLNCDTDLDQIIHLAQVCSPRERKIVVALLNAILDSSHETKGRLE